MDERRQQRLEALGKLFTGQDASTTVRDYFRNVYKLPGNPFPPGGIADASGDNPPLQDEIFDKIVNFLFDSYDDNKTRFLVVRGDYGAGKTHTLRFLENTINGKLNKGDAAARAIYVERPRVEVQELNRTILRGLGNETVRKYIWFAIREMLLSDLNNSNPSEQLKNLVQKLTSPRIKGRGKGNAGSTLSFWADDDPAKTAPFREVFNAESTIDYRIFLQKLDKQRWDIEEVRHYLEYLLFKAVNEAHSIQLVQSFVGLVLAPDEKSFASWDALVNLSPGRASSLKAPDFLQFLLRVMAINGITHVYLLLDEFEEVPLQGFLTAREQQDYLYTMREVLNKIHSGLSVVIASNPLGWEATRDIAPPFADVNFDIIDLPRIEVDDVMKLVEYYYSRAREGTEYNTDIILPFSQDFINNLLQNFPTDVLRTPRNMIQLLYKILAHTAENQIVAATLEVITPVLAEFGTMKLSSAQKNRRRR